MIPGLLLTNRLIQLMRKSIPKLLIILSFLILVTCGNSEKENHQSKDLMLSDSSDIKLEQIDSNLGDPSKGKRLFLQCRACHSLERKEPHKIGPNLYNFFGRKAGSQKKYKYSSQLTESGIMWDYENLDQWLENPQALIPENKMVYVGMRNPQDREDLIAYLLKETQ